VLNLGFWCFTKRLYVNQSFVTLSRLLSKHSRFPKQALTTSLHNPSQNEDYKYERDEVKPTIDVVKKLADVLETTVGYLLGETEDRELLKDPTMLRRLNDIAKFPEEDKNCILYTTDAMINNVKLKGLNA